MKTPDALPGGITGVLERIIFNNEENGYCIAEIRALDGKRRFTAAGPMPGVQCGETLNLHGEWVRHPKHGEQLKVARYSTELPATLSGIRKYLGSGMIAGIGKTYADKIVDHFGIQTLNIISDTSARLKEVPGIGPRRAKSIKAAWDEQKAVRDVMVFLQTYGVTTSQCVRLVKKYGNGTQRILQNEPYRLAAEIERIGFKTADRIALNLGFSTHSRERIEAGISHWMQLQADEGHTLASEESIVEGAGELLSVDAGLVLDRVHALQQRRALERLTTESARAYQLPKLAASERAIANSLARLAREDSTLPPIRIDKAVDWAEAQAGFEFAPQQREAVRNALRSKLTVLTGGPGTGKTTILRAVVAILKAKRTRILLASPTGRAAQRLSESAGAPASTIHRLLKHDPGSGGFLHTAENPLPCDCLIVDEASMLDTRLAAQLFAAVPSTAHLILVGDADQLPSVGPGNVLGDLIQAPPAVVTRLSTIYRQESLSEIVTTAHAILSGDPHPGELVRSLRDLKPDRDLHFIESEEAEQCLEAIRYLARDYVPATYGLDPIHDIQVIAPMHRGTVGIESLNKALQESLNPEAKARQAVHHTGYASARQGHFREQTKRELPWQIEYGATLFRIGDKVIQTRNNYDKNVFNGDSGAITAINQDATGLSVRFGNEVVEYAKGELSEIQLAYAISIHKSQGSEYPVILIPLLKQHFMLLKRNLVYTGITRARQKVFIVGQSEAYRMAVRNTDTSTRRTYLRERLRQAVENQAN